MSCFFSCFRVKDSGANLVSPSQEPVAPRSKNALSSLFQCDEDGSRKGEECQNRLPGEIDVREFKDESKFSKSYGNSLETPVKIRKALEKWEDASARDGGQKSLKFESRLPNESMEKLKLEKQPDESSILAGSGSLLDSPSSCMTDGHYTGGVSSSSIQRSDIHNTVDAHSSEQSKNESAISSISSEQSGSAGAHIVLKPLPYSNMEESDDEELKDEVSSFGHQRGSNEPKDRGESKPTPESDLSVTKEMNDDGGLASWFKPISAKRDGSNKQLTSISSQNKKPPSDRPILGMVAAHWNDGLPSDPPKWWDGNGIPNSTNKYKEDQKVSWHATPFEERLEKALSEESLISQRKPNSSTPPYEIEESDTAISHFQSSPHLKSVVSF